MRARRATRAAAVAEAHETFQGAGVASFAGSLAGVGVREEAGVVQATVEQVGYAPIVRLDAARREIELCATSEAVDSYGTIFNYAASKDAFTRWIGNVREMHERRAVGQRVGVQFDDEAKKVFVTIRISRGAQDTWEKVLDGTLRGASIGASNVRWQKKWWPVGGEDRTVDVAQRYDLVELSLVDNPSNPDALGFTFVRDATPDLALLDRLEEEFTAEDAEIAEGAQRSQRPEGQRGGRGVIAESGREGTAMQTSSTSATSASASATSALKSGSGRLHEAARAVLAGCGCALCAAALAALDVDMDEGAGTEAEEERGSWAGTNRVREAALARALGASLRASTTHLERLDAGMGDLRAAMREAMGEMRGQVSQAMSQVAHEVASEMGSTAGELGRRLERLEAQPTLGGPAARPVEKTHALHARGAGGLAGQPSAAEQFRALEALAGRIADPQAQIAVAAELIRMQREGIGG